MTQIKTNNKIRVLIANGQRMIHDALSNALIAHGGFSVDRSVSLETTLIALRARKNDNVMVLIDHTMPGMQGLRSVRQVIEAVPKGFVVLFSYTCDANFLWRAIDLGAKGSIQTSQSLLSLPTALQLIHEGNVFVPSPESRRNILYAEKNTVLDEAQIFMLRAAAEGKTNKEIALELDLSEISVKMKMRSIYQTLSARNRAHAVMLASKANLI